MNAYGESGAITATDVAEYPESDRTAGGSAGTSRLRGRDVKPLTQWDHSTVLQRNWTELIKPNKLNVEAGADPKREATVVAEPLERGFGLTLGNSIRRILLSSLQGAAVTSVHIDGVLHEFSSIPGRARGCDGHRPQHQVDRPAHGRRRPEAHAPARRGTGRGDGRTHRDGP